MNAVAYSSSEEDCDEEFEMPAALPPPPPPTRDYFDLDRLQVLPLMDREELTNNSIMLGRFPPSVREKLYLAVICSSVSFNPAACFRPNRGLLIPTLPAIAYTCRQTYYEYLVTLISKTFIRAGNNDGRFALHQFLTQCGISDARSRVQNIFCADYCEQLASNEYLLETLPNLTTLDLGLMSKVLVKPRWLGMEPFDTGGAPIFVPRDVSEVFQNLGLHRAVLGLRRLRALMLRIDDQVDIGRFCTHDPILCAALLKRTVTGVFGAAVPSQSVHVRVIVIGGRFGAGAEVEVTPCPSRVLGRWILHIEVF